ncbi:MAG TPA: hypothetical protein P5105_02420 [Victivallales bacterium]|nr:hypothetical protein [Victivallales bacterium]HPO90130.1 hypothetical protein [Victivallales bacterium]HRR06114.1 hypothetical protein [Victivallales bacterium]HRR28430.1 hypothetical protein [Victivallales bacterium]HRU00528.1 hypothetical protein [Victivallales bacterium]
MSIKKMKAILKLISLLFTIFFLNYGNFYAEEKNEEKTNNEGQISDFEGAFTIKNWDKDLKVPEVIDDKRNILIEPFTEQQIAKIAKTEGLASKLKPKEKITWKPLWRYDGPGSVALPSIAISTDSSLLAIVERTGETKGPNGSRIVILRTSDWIILRIHEIKQKKINKISFFPDSTDLILSSVKQPELKEFNEIICLDADSGTIQRTKKFRNEIKDIILLKNKIIVIFNNQEKNENEIYEIDTDSLNLKNNYKSSNKKGIIDEDRESEKFIFAGDKRIEIFSASAANPIAQFTEENSTPIAVKFIPSTDNSFVVAFENAEAKLFRQSVKKTLIQNPAPIILIDREAQKILLTSVKNDRAVIFNTPEYEEIDSFSISTLKPKTRGDLIFAAVISKENYLFIDNHGNIFTCSKDGKKWKKNILIEAMK